MSSKYSEDQLNELMADLVKIEIQGYAVSRLNESGTLFLDDELSSHLFGNAWFDKTEVVVLPVSRLSKDFFNLSTGQAGEIIRKSISYGIRLMIIGDVKSYRNSSTAFSAFVDESNRGEHVLFLENDHLIAEKLRSYNY